MHTLRYTALIRTCNSAATLPATLASLRGQTLPPDAHVIVDSGSTDNTLALVPAGSTVHRFEQTRFNYADALNQGLTHVRTDLVLIISSHTSLQSVDAMEFAVELLERDDRLGAAYFCFEDRGALEFRLIDASSFTGFNGLWNTCALVRTALLAKRPFRRDVPISEDQEWSSWLLHTERKSVARVAGGGLTNRNPRQFSLRKLVAQYTAVARFVRPELLERPHLATLAKRVVTPDLAVGLRDRYVHLGLLAGLLGCRLRARGTTSPPQRRILFLNHSASRNGASILLLHLLRWLHAHGGFKLEVLSNGGGPLIAEFRAVATTRIWRNPLRTLHKLDRPWAQRWLARLEAPLLRARLAHRHYDLVYANTAASWNELAALSGGAGALLWHIHELPYALRMTLADDRAIALLGRVSRLVAVSEPVAAALAGPFGVPSDRVDLVHGFVPAYMGGEVDRMLHRRRLHAQWDWPADAFVVGACGGLGWRKGSDLFLQVADRLRRAEGGERMRFVWVGGGAAGSPEGLQFAHDLRLLGLEGVCRHVHSTAAVDAGYCAMDVFALPSREDPFPLVMLEAATHGLPTVCFAQAGGAPEFVGEDAGVVVPYLDLDAFAAALAGLRDEPARCAALGRAARQRVGAEHGVETQGPEAAAQHRTLPRRR